MAVAPALHATQFKEDEQQILTALLQFQQSLPQWQYYSKVTWALFLKTLRTTLRSCSYADKDETLKPVLVQLSGEYAEVFDWLLVQNKQAKGLSLDLQAYLKEVAKLRLHLLVQLGEYDDIQTLLEQMVKWFIGNHIDQVYVFLKAFKKQLAVLKESRDGKVRDLLKTVSVYMLDRVLLREGLLNLEGADAAEKETEETKEETKVIQATESVRTSSTWEHSKVVELALQILLKAWKAWGFGKQAAPGAAQSDSTWAGRALFRDTVVKVVEGVADKFPANANYTATAIRLQTLAARYYVQQADSFGATEDHLRKVADSLRTHVYSD